MENIQQEIEDKIIDLIALGAQGRLIVFKPEKSDKDLIVEKRSDYNNLEIYIKEEIADYEFKKNKENKK